MSLEVTYFAEGRNKTIYGSPILSETVASLSGLTPASADVVRIKSLANNRFDYALNASATSSAGAHGHYISQGDIIALNATPGWKLSVTAAA